MITEYFGGNKIISLIYKIAAFYGLLQNSASFGERHPLPPSMFEPISSQLRNNFLAGVFASSV